MDNDNDNDDDVELNGFLLVVLRKLGTLCHNRQCTESELGQVMDAHPQRARDWLNDLFDLGLVEKLPGRMYFPTPEGWEEIEKNLK